MRILLADDQPEIRSALRLLLQHQPGLYVVEEAREAQDLLAKAGGVNPDVVLMDWELPDHRTTNSTKGSGPGLLKDLRSRHLGLLVVALSGRPEARKEALSAGADAFVSKGDPPELLLATLHALAPAGARSDLSSD